MSILSYIKDPIPFIIIGGISGIGKTSIIDHLLNECSTVFAQPKSYTTRERRNENDRYDFISKNEIKEMFNNGRLLNLDEVHGDFYGISVDSVDNIKRLNKIPIKEIHPKNFDKFKTKRLNTINVLIENKHFTEKSAPFIQRENRKEDEFDIYSYNGYDICLNISGLTPQEAANYLIKRVIAFRLHMSKYLTHPNLIDETNKNGYNTIATEFYDYLRITTKNFHDASINFFETAFRSNPKFNNTTKLEILELGSGNGWLFENIKPLGHNIYGLEISEKMNAHYCKKTFRCSARSIPTEACFFDLVVGSLIDPLLSPEVFVDVERVLKPGGEFIFTIPSSEWASNFEERQPINKTTFRLQNGHKVEVFSFCDALSFHPYLNCIYNLEIIESTSLYLEEDYREPISDAISKAALNANKSFYSLPIVMGVRLKKGL